MTYRLTGALALTTALTVVGPIAAQDGSESSGWSLAQAAEPYSGTTVDVTFLLRPGYEAAMEMLPEFEDATGIDINVTQLPYENALGQQVRDFVSQGDLDIALIDLVWIGNFAQNDWIVPVAQLREQFPDTVNPDLDLDDFFPVTREAFGSWDGELYGLPFDNYSGLLFYNRCMLEEAGFDGPPETWQAVMDEYGPALTGDDQYAYALQSKRNETQSADSFARMIWAFDGSFLDGDFRPNVASENSLAGLQFRQDLMEFMPQGIVAYDHAESVNALAQGDVAFITEWSSFYSTLANGETSRIADCLGVAPEPEGPGGLNPALGGFSLAVASQATEDEQAAAWLFIQWLTNKENSQRYLELGGVPARQSVYEQDGIAEEYPFVPALVESWENAVAEFRPRFAEWPEISEVVQQYGTQMMLGEVTIEEGAEQISSEMEAILEDAGYYDGEKPQIQ